MYRCILIVLLLTTVNVHAQTQVVYDDALGAGFQNWSWATVNLNNSNPVAVGRFSIAMDPDAWEGLMFHSDNSILLSQYNQLSFRVHGGSSGGQALRLYLQAGGTALGDVVLTPPSANSWQQVTIHFGNDLGIQSGGFNDIVFQANVAGNQPTVYIDQVELLANTDPPPEPTDISINIDTTQDRRAIDPMIYGVNFASDQQLTELKFPSHRWGGNSTTRYNWKQDITHTANDWFYFNIPNAVDDEQQLPSGSGSNRFIEASLNNQSQPLITIPMIGWAPLDDREKKWGFSQLKYGPQNLDECRFFDVPPNWCTADAGDGTCNNSVNTTGFCSTDGYIINNDPTDTSQPIGTQWVTDWMAHIAGRFGTATQGGVQFWALDNEPMLWNSTHRDIHPQPLTYDGLWQKTVEYASAIKAQDSEAKVFGPTSWGWCAYFTSAADVAFDNGSCTDGPDRQAHGGLALVPWYLQQVCDYEQSTGVRLVDYLDIHYYPQGDVAGLGGASDSEDPVTAARRLRSVKELYDSNHVSESWINEPIYFIPRVRAWIDQYCPGTKLAITEYKFGPDDGITGALAQAEVLGVFGREGVDLANRFVSPVDGTKAESAFKMFLNFDGSGSRIRGDSVRAVSADVDQVGSYAIHDSVSGQLYVILINKETGPMRATLTLDQAPVGAMQVYRFDAESDLSFISSVNVSGGVAETLPGRSATLLIIPLQGLPDLIFANGFD